MTESRQSAKLYVTDDQRWRAVDSRDRRADDAFLYAVRTTRVYCLPSCPSRRPKRENVRFFSTCGQAQRSGYRACKKCRPDRSEQGRVPDAVTRACELIERADEPPTLDRLAAAVGRSPTYLHRLFKKVVGVTPKAYAAARRAERLREQLHEQRTVLAAIYGSGFGSSSRLYESVADQLGMTPTEYRRGGTGREIRYASAPCEWGRVLVAATERGICSIQLGDSPEELRSELIQRFPSARLTEDLDEMRECVERVVAHVESRSKAEFDLPLDVRGTAFQRQVWEALRAIPPGSTATYSEIARRIGKPDAARAVAGACAANRLAVAIPCHRVVRKDGDISDYRWGRERKRKLLDREAERE